MCCVATSDPRCSLPVTMYSTTHAHLVHMCPHRWRVPQFALKYPCNLPPPPPPPGRPSLGDRLPPPSGRPSRASPGVCKGGAGYIMPHDEMLMGGPRGGGAAGPGRRSSPLDQVQPWCFQGASAAGYRVCSFFPLLCIPYLHTPKPPDTHPPWRYACGNSGSHASQTANTPPHTSSSRSPPPKLTPPPEVSWSDHLKLQAEPSAPSQPIKPFSGE